MLNAVANSVIVYQILNKSIGKIRSSSCMHMIDKIHLSVCNDSDTFTIITFDILHIYYIQEY